MTAPSPPTSCTRLVPFGIRPDEDEPVAAGMVLEGIPSWSPQAGVTARRAAERRRAEAGPAAPGRGLRRSVGRFRTIATTSRSSPARASPARPFSPSSTTSRLGAGLRGVHRLGARPLRWSGRRACPWTGRVSSADRRPRRRGRGTRNADAGRPRRQDVTPDSRARRVPRDHADRPPARYVRRRRVGRASARRQRCG